MINNGERAARGAWLTALLACSACARAPETGVGSFQGVVELEEVSVGFELGGRVRSVAVKEGDVLAAGAPVADLDDELERSARAASASNAEVAKVQVAAVQAGARAEEVAAAAAKVRGAKANEDQIARNLARQRQLFAGGAVAAASVDDLQSGLDAAVAQRQALEQSLALLRRGARTVDVNAAEAKADAARTAVRLDDVRLARHDLRAPSAGTVLDVHVDPGEVVAAGTPVVTLADTTRPYADVFVPQANLAGIHVGSAAHARVDALPSAFAGRVEHIGRRTEFTPRYLFSDSERAHLVVRVRVRLEDPTGALFAGVQAFVTIDTGK